MPTAKRPSLRWTYLGLMLAVTLWLSSGILDQRIRQLHELEQLEDDTEPLESLQSSYNPLLLMRAGAVLLAFTSISLAGYQLLRKNKDHYQGAKRSADHESPSRT